jgi:hypothetical protein
VNAGPEPKPNVHESVLGLLVENYAMVCAAWRSMLRVNVVSQHAPWNHARELTEMGGDADTLISFGENAAVLAAQAVGRHLGALARLYGPDPLVEPGAPDPDRWPHAAAYAPARAICEGTALIGWLLDPEPARPERIARAARFALWSSPKRWRDTIVGAGLAVSEDDNGTAVVCIGANPAPLSVGSLVKVVHGPAAVKRNSKWSKLLHNDPGLLAPLATIRCVGEGLHIGSQIREDQHLRLALDLVALLQTAGERQAAYWGRNAAELPEACERVRATIEPVLPAIEAWQRQRDAVLFGS